MLVNKFIIGQLLLSEQVASVVRKMLKTMAGDAKVTLEDVQQIIEDEVIKREVLDGEKAVEAHKKILKATAEYAKVKAASIIEN